MGALSGRLLRKRIEDDDLDNRIVVSPLLEPDEQLRDDQASVDIRLGFEFALVSPSAHGSIDEFEPEGSVSRHLTDLYRNQYVPFGKCLVIHPHQFILAATLEYTRLPSDVMAYVIGRSTWGRLGLIVATAVGIQPGFAGTLTLELRNLGETPLTLYPGQTIGQLFFHTILPGVETDQADLPSSAGQYGGRTSLLPRRISSGNTQEKLSKLVETTRGS